MRKSSYVGAVGQYLLPQYKTSDYSEILLRTSCNVEVLSPDTLRIRERGRHAHCHLPQNTLTWGGASLRKSKPSPPAAPDTENGEETRTTLTNHRYIYRGYLQIAALNLTRSTLNDLWLITWDPTESPRGLGGGLDKPKGFASQGRAANGVAASHPVATRPLAIQQSGIWHIYGTDLPKNVTELYSTSGYIHTTYTYSPYGLVTSSGNVTQPIQWSSEYADTDIGLVYYNYRHYNPLDGRWTAKESMGETISPNLYAYCKNLVCSLYDYLGLMEEASETCTKVSASRELSLPKAAFAFLSAFGVYGASAQLDGDIKHCRECCNSKKEGFTVGLDASYSISVEVGSAAISWGEVRGRMGWYAGASGSGTVSAGYNSCSNEVSGEGSASATVEYGLIVSLEMLRALDFGGRGGMYFSVSAIPRFSPDGRSVRVDLKGCGGLQMEVWIRVGITSALSYAFSKTADISSCMSLGSYSFDV